MREQIKRSIAITIVVAAMVVIIIAKIDDPSSLGDWAGCISYGITAASIFYVLYDLLLWRLDFTNGTPKLGKYYIGEIISVYTDDNGRRIKKPIRIRIKQTYLSVAVSAETNTTKSLTVHGAIKKEEGENLLYYIYRTMPSVAELDNNPIQYGTTRIIIDEGETLTGQYWTRQKTAGDIKMHRCSKEEWYKSLSNDYNTD